MKRCGQLFLRLTLLNMHLGVSLPTGKFRGGEYLNESRNAVY